MKTYQSRQLKVVSTTLKEGNLYLDYAPIDVNSLYHPTSKNHRDFLIKTRESYRFNLMAPWGIDPTAGNYSVESMGVGMGRSRISRNKTHGRACQVSGTRGGRSIRAPVNRGHRRKVINRDERRLSFISSFSACLLDQSYNPLIVGVHDKDYFKTTINALKWLNSVEGGQEYLNSRSILIVSQEQFQNGEMRGFRNIEGVTIVDYTNLQTLDLLRGFPHHMPKLLLTKSGLEEVLRVRF